MLPVAQAVPQHSCPVPPQLSQSAVPPLQVRFVPPVQSFPAQQNRPAAFPHATHVEDEALHINDELVQLPAQQGCPAPPHATQRWDVELQIRFEAPPQVVPPQQGCPAAEPQMHMAGEPEQTRLLPHEAGGQHGLPTTPHWTQSEPSQARLDWLQMPPAQQGLFSNPQHPDTSQPPHPLHVPTSLTVPFWL